MNKHAIRITLIGICNRLAIGDEIPFQDGFIRRDERSAYRWINDDKSHSFTARKTKIARDKMIAFLADGILDYGGTCIHCQNAMQITQVGKKFCCKKCYDEWHYHNDKAVLND